MVVYRAVYSKLQLTMDKLLWFRHSISFFIRLRLIIIFFSKFTIEFDVYSKFLNVYLIIKITCFTALIILYILFLPTIQHFTNPKFYILPKFLDCFLLGKNRNVLSYGNELSRSRKRSSLCDGKERSVSVMSYKVLKVVTRREREKKKR
ncbi:Protein of unknown function [Gryllus bimaculatus]|nr:Protein of unknown function [Gryllus bimaculatus]